MWNLFFAQAPTLTKEQSEALKGVAEALLKGMPSAADKAPNSYMMLIAIVVMMITMAVLCWLVLRYLKDSSSALATRDRDQDTREDIRIQKIQEMGHQCHQTAMAMADKFAVHSANSDSRTTAAIERCSIAVTVAQQQGQRTETALENNNKLIEKCIDKLDSLGTKLDSFGNPSVGQ